MSSDSDDTSQPLVLSFQNQSTRFWAKGPNVNSNISSLGSRNNMPTSTRDMLWNIDRPRYAQSAYDQRSIYSRRETSPISVRSVSGLQPKNFNYSYYPGGMSSYTSMHNGRSGSPVSLRTIDSNTSVSAADIASAFKNMRFNNNDVRLIKEAYNKFVKSRFRRRVEKRRKLTKFSKGYRRRSGEDSGEQGSDSSISSDDHRSTRSYRATSNKGYKASSSRSSKTDFADIRTTLGESTMYRDCSESLKQSTIKNTLSGGPNIQKHSVQYKQPNASMISQKDRFKIGFPLPNERFNKSIASFPILDKPQRLQSNENGINKKKGTETNGTLETESEQEEIFSELTVLEQSTFSGNKSQRKRNLDNDDNDLTFSDKKRNKRSPSHNLKTKSNVFNQVYTHPINNGKSNDFVFAKPQFPVKKFLNVTNHENNITKPKQQLPSKLNQKSVEKPQKPSEKSQKPAEISQKPAEISQKPAEKSQKPAEKSQKLADKSQKAADESQKPADESQKPAEKSQKPADKFQKPAHISQKPADKSQKPADKSQKPANKSQKPVNKSPEKLMPQSQQQPGEKKLPLANKSITKPVPNPAEKLVSNSPHPKDILISMSKQPLDVIHHPITVQNLPKNRINEGKEQDEECETTQQSTTDMSMRPSFFKRKLFTQKVDLAEGKNVSCGKLLQEDSPQSNIYSKIQKEKNRCRKLVTNQSCLSRDVSREDSNLLDLIHKIVPPDRMNVTSASNKTEVYKNTKKPANIGDKWDVTALLATCENDAGSDTYTDDEIFGVENESRMITKATNTRDSSSTAVEKSKIQTLKEPVSKVNVQNSPFENSVIKKRRDGVKSYWDTSDDSDQMNIPENRELPSQQCQLKEIKKSFLNVRGTAESPTMIKECIIPLKHNSKAITTSTFNNKTAQKPKSTLNQVNKKNNKENIATVTEKTIKTVHNDKQTQLISSKKNNIAKEEKNSNNIGPDTEKIIIKKKNDQKTTKITKKQIRNNSPTSKITPVAKRTMTEKSVYKVHKTKECVSTKNSNQENCVPNNTLNMEKTADTVTKTRGRKKKSPETLNNVKSLFKESPKVVQPNSKTLHTSVKPCYQTGKNSINQSSLEPKNKFTFNDTNLPLINESDMSADNSNSNYSLRIGPRTARIVKCCNQPPKHEQSINDSGITITKSLRSRDIDVSVYLSSDVSLTKKTKEKPKTFKNNNISRVFKSKEDNSRESDVSFTLTSDKTSASASNKTIKFSKRVANMSINKNTKTKMNKSDLSLSLISDKKSQLKTVATKRCPTTRSVYNLKSNFK